MKFYGEIGAKHKILVYALNQPFLSIEFLKIWNFRFIFILYNYETGNVSEHFTYVTF